MFHSRLKNWHQVCLSKPMNVKITSKLQHHEYLFANAVPLFQTVEDPSARAHRELRRGVGRV